MGVWRVKETGVRRQQFAITIILALATAMLALAGWLMVGASTPAGATDATRARHTELVLAVPYEGQWYQVHIGMFIEDKPGSDFEAAAAEAREAMLARFPGAFEAPESEVSGQYALNSYKWGSGSVSWGYNAAGKPSIGGDAAAMSGGASAWNGAGGALFSFGYSGTSSANTGACEGGPLDGKNTVGWKAQSGSVLAVTCAWSSGGNAVEFDMQFDPDWGWTTSGTTNVDLQSVATHEFGHAAGLGHSQVTSAVMYASYTVGTIKRSPTQDDVDGLVTIYPGPTPTATPTNTPFSTATPTPTQTPTTNVQPPTATPTSPAAATATPTRTATKTPTPRITVKKSPTATPTVKTVAPTPTPTVPGSLALRPGVNLIGWPNKSTAPRQALKNLDSVIEVVYGWDKTTGRWQRYGPGMPDYVNTLSRLEQGKAYWVVVNSDAMILMD